METLTPMAPARIAREVRDLAREAHRMLTASPTRPELRRLSRRIACLAGVCEGPIVAWLEGLRREVRSAARRAGSSRTACTCT
jgi:hypothetical protein